MFFSSAQAQFAYPKGQKSGKVKIHLITAPKPRYYETSTILEQDLRELQNPAFLFAELGLGQAEKHLSSAPFYTLFFICLALVVVLCAHVC